MFRVIFYVRDEKLGEAFKRLSGLAMEVSHQFVPNAESAPNGKLKAKAGSNLELVERELRKVTKGDPIMTVQMQAVMKTLGMGKTSANYFTNQLVKAGVLEKAERNGNVRTWSWVKP